MPRLAYVSTFTFMYISIVAMCIAVPSPHHVPLHRHRCKQRVLPAATTSHHDHGYWEGGGTLSILAHVCIYVYLCLFSRSFTLYALPPPFVEVWPSWYGLLALTRPLLSRPICGGVNRLSFHLIFDPRPANHHRGHFISYRRPPCGPPAEHDYGDLIRPL